MVEATPGASSLSRFQIKGERQSTTTACRILLQREFQATLTVETLRDSSVCGVSVYQAWEAKMTNNSQSIKPRLRSTRKSLLN